MPNGVAGALQGVRVLDLSRVMAGPFAAQMLADLGAEVIHVERPVAGDETRAFGPPYLRDGLGRDTTESGYYLSVNRGKRSFTADLTAPDDRERVRSLANASDIVIENFKVGTLARYGLDYEKLSADRRDLIYCSVTGFGQTGPRKNEPAYDFAIQALCGLMSVTGESEELLGSTPQKVGVPIVDLMTGLYATVAILAALNRRNQTGDGEYIDMALLDVGISMLTNQAMNFLVSSKLPIRNGNSHPNIQPQNSYRCSDGLIVIAVGNDSQFRSFCEAVDLTELSKDDRFRKNASRIENLGELQERIASRLIKESRRHWIERLANAGVPAAPINNIEEALRDPQVVHRQGCVRIMHPLAGEAPSLANPIRFRNAPIRHDIPPPLLGQHTANIIEELEAAAAARVTRV